MINQCQIRQAEGPVSHFDIAGRCITGLLPDTQTGNVYVLFEQDGELLKYLRC